MPDERPTPRLWDLFCRVIDNFGDAGVCWRLAADLVARGQRVRLWIDDLAPLAFMAPDGAPGVEVRAWHAGVDLPAPGDVVVEAFGCDPPPAFVARMAARRPAPVWINLEHLSAEPFVERSHGLPSPQRNGLTKWFFFPGFSERTGGLLREPGLLDARAAFDRAGWLARHGVPAAGDDLVVAVFCYDTAPMAALIEATADRPTRWLATPGPAQRLLGAVPGPTREAVHPLPWFDQPGFDRLLWSADLSVVRGEDSVVRAIWAGGPFVWHIYPQDDGAHGPKLQALLDLMSAGADPATAAAVGRLWRRFNGLEAGPLVLPPIQPWAAMTRALRDRLAAQPDLVTRLLAFIAGKS